MRLTPVRRWAMLPMVAMIVTMPGCGPAPASAVPLVPRRFPLETADGPTPSPSAPSIAVATATPDAVPAMTSVEPAAVIDVPGASGTIALVTDGTTVWAAGDGAILRIDAATNKVERLPAPTQSDDTTMAFADDGLWVTRWAGRHLYRLDPRTGKVLLSVDLPAGQDRIHR